VHGNGAWERGSGRAGVHRYFSMMSEFRASSIDLRLGVLRGISHSSQGATAVGVPLFSLPSGSVLRTTWGEASFMGVTVWGVPSSPKTSGGVSQSSVFVMVRSERRGLDSFPGESLGLAPDDRRPRAGAGDVVRPKATCGFIGLALSGEAFMASTLREN